MFGSRRLITCGYSVGKSVVYGAVVQSAPYDALVAEGSGHENILVW